MDMNIKQRIASGALALALLGGTGASVAAQNQGNSGNQGGAAGLVAAVVQAQNSPLVNVEVVDSLNNLRALNNILNNSPFLNNINVELISIGDINVDIENVLNDLDVVVTDVIGVVVLDGGDLIFLT